MPFLLDASAWIEYFVNGEGARTVYDALSSDECGTCIATISEVVNWALRNGKDFLPMVDCIEKFSRVIYIDRVLAVNAGSVNFERKKTVRKWGIIDSYVLTTAIAYGFTVLTKDSDFRGLPNAQLL